MRYLILIALLIVGCSKEPNLVDRPYCKILGLATVCCQEIVIVTECGFHLQNCDHGITEISCANNVWTHEK